MIRKLASGEYRLYSRKKDKTGRRRNLGTFKTRHAAEKHERAIQYYAGVEAQAAPLARVILIELAPQIVLSSEELRQTAL
jgi:ribosomal protein L2